MTVTLISLFSQTLDLMYRSVELEHARHGHGGPLVSCPDDNCREAVEIVEKADTLAVKL